MDLTKNAEGVIINNDYYYRYKELVIDMTRRSKQRDAILTVVRSMNIHPTADWIYARVKKEIPSISLGTVYRNLKLLQRMGKVVELEFSNDVSRFDGNLKTHYHFRCECCNCIFDVKETINEDIDKKVARETGFEISRHILEFHGLCRECQVGGTGQVETGKENLSTA
ncbi:transcriptional repressor [Chloroflexota bacterium]